MLELLGLDKKAISEKEAKFQPYLVFSLGGVAKRTSTKKGSHSSFYELISLDVPCHTKALELTVDLYHQKVGACLFFLFTDLKHLHILLAYSAGRTEVYSRW